MVLLRGEGRDQVLPICIGPAEAHSIASAFNKRPFRRPLSHDLMKSVLSKLDCKVERILITDLKEGTFYAVIFFETKDGQTLEIDSRPSDAIALAIRYDADIYVREDILEENAVALSDHEAIGADTDDEQVAVSDDEEQDPVVKLKKELTAAVQDERYEDAARIRDELQQLMDN
ncbi:hypothetical protein BVY04_04310 [bacterium M21]|nr:hypothetical protein BVY04_04310 [bacterium M21]